MNRDDFRMFHSLRVRWAEVDRQDVVFNAHYFLYFDVAVTEYWRTIGLEYPAGYIERAGADLYAVKASAEFHGSARYDDVLDVACRVSRIGRSSAQLVLGIWRGEDHLTTGELVYVNADVRTRTAKPWPEEFRSKVLAYEKTPPL
jgi:acyl-CoA thioester hydrolase